MARMSKNKVDEAREQATSAEHAYLRQRGWRYTSSTPNCHWMWERTFTWDDDANRAGRPPAIVTKTILCDTATAIAIQSGADALGRGAP